MSDAPRVTEAQVEGLIVKEQYHRFPHTTLTICCLTLRNGFNVTGESASVTAAGFDAETGKRIARTNAFNKIWQLEGYLLRQQLHEASTTPDRRKP